MKRDYADVTARQYSYIVSQFLAFADPPWNQLDIVEFCNQYADQEYKKGSPGHRRKRVAAITWFIREWKIPGCSTKDLDSVKLKANFDNLKPKNCWSTK